MHLMSHLLAAKTAMINRCLLLTLAYSKGQGEGKAYFAVYKWLDL